MPPGVYAPVANLNPAMLQYMSFWPRRNGPELLVERRAQRHGAFLQQSAAKPSARISAPLRADYILRRARLAFRRLHDRRRQQPDPAGRPAVRLLRRCCAAQVASLRRRTSSRPHILNTLHRRIFARRVQSTTPSRWPVSRVQSRFVTGAGPGRHRRRRRRHHHRRAAPSPRPAPTTPPTSGTAAIFSPIPTTCRSARASTRSAPASGSSASRTTKTPLRASSAQASFTSLTTFLQGTVSTFQVVPDRQRTRLAKPVRRVVRRRTPSSCGRNLTLQLGIRQEFTTGWNEVSGRAANYITDANGVLETDAAAWAIRSSRRTTRRTCSRRGSAWPGTCSATARPRSAPASEPTIR